MDELPPSDTEDNENCLGLDGVRSRHSVDYMLRTTKQHISFMFQVADNKASIITGISVVLLTLIIGFIQKSGPSLSLIVLGVFLFSAAITALIAAMPSRTRFTKKRKKGKAPMTLNPLFFGHATSQSEDEYVDDMSSVLHSDSKIYETILKDIHQLSKVAEVKFTRLRNAYKILIVGLIATVIAEVCDQWLI